MKTNLVSPIKELSTKAITLFLGFMLIGITAQEFPFLAPSGAKEAEVAAVEWMDMRHCAICEAELKGGDYLVYYVYGSGGDFRYIHLECME